MFSMQWSQPVHVPCFDTSGSLYSPDRGLVLLLPHRALYSWRLCDVIGLFLDFGMIIVFGFLQELRRLCQSPSHLRFMINELFRRVAASYASLDAALNELVRPGMPWKALEENERRESVELIEAIVADLQIFAERLREMREQAGKV